MKRSEIVKTAKQIKNHDEVVLSYNKIRPLPVGYTLKVSDDWCAAFVSVVFYYNKYTKIAECSVPRMIGLASDYGLLHDRTYKPKKGDIVVYDWDSVKDGDHVGIVIDIDNTYLMTVREGNKNGAIGNRVLFSDDSSVLYYITPKFESETESAPSQYESVEDIVKAIIRGEFGNGDTRKEKLYNYFQKKVNEYLNK